MKVVVRVTPDSRKETIHEDGRGMLVMHVRARAQDNMANKRAVTLLARHLKVSPSRVRLIAGHRAQKKTFELQS